ncbi:exported hypothetical protein [Candidatus Terasakiella magnetica]|nr:exported hypothetical protein [Candidatus Terasakiella magnetica]
MNIRLLATLALLSVGLSGCAIDPYALSGINWYPQNSGSAYYQPAAPNYWGTPAYSAWQPSLSGTPYHREEARRPHRPHDQDERNNHHSGWH